MKRQLFLTEQGYRYFIEDCTADLRFNTENINVRRNDTVEPQQTVDGRRRLCAHYLLYQR